jgi:hypothetical protein
MEYTVSYSFFGAVYGYETVWWTMKNTVLTATLKAVT